MGMRSAMLLAGAWLLVTLVHEGQGHGYLREPPGRSSMWRLGFSTPRNYNDNGLNCGGNRRSCGVCGDPPQGAQDNMAGGKYATGLLSRNYTEGDTIKATVVVTANHVGWFEFHLCPNNDVTRRVTEQCLSSNVLRMTNGQTRYNLQKGETGPINFQLQLPQGLTCSQCVLRWKWVTGNSWGTDSEGNSCVGCGAYQEQFYGCSDVRIAPRQGGGLQPYNPDRPPTQAPYNPDRPLTQAPYNPDLPPTQAPYNPYQQNTQAPYNPYQTNAPVYNPYGGQQTQAPYNPYGQQTQAPYNPYGQQTQAPYNPYGQQTQAPYNPYRPQTQAPYNPYRPQTQAPYNPYGYTPAPGVQSPYNNNQQPATQYPQYPFGPTQRPAITNYPFNPQNTQSPPYNPYAQMTQGPYNPYNPQPTNAPYNPYQTQAPYQPQQTNAPYNPYQPQQTNAPYNPYPQQTNAPYNPYPQQTNAPYKPITNRPFTNAPYNAITNAPYRPITNRPYTNAPYNPYPATAGPGPYNWQPGQQTVAPARPQTAAPYVPQQTQAPIGGGGGGQGGGLQCRAVGIWAAQPDMAQWCVDNCKIGNCPPDYCSCL